MRVCVGVSLCAGSGRPVGSVSVPGKVNPDNAPHVIFVGRDLQPAFETAAMLAGPHYGVRGMGPGQHRSRLTPVYAQAVPEPHALRGARRFWRLLRVCVHAFV